MEIPIFFFNISFEKQMCFSSNASLKQKKKQKTKFFSHKNTHKQTIYDFEQFSSEENLLHGTTMNLCMILTEQY